MGTVLISTPGDASLDPCLRSHHLQQSSARAAKTKQFKQVFRGSDRNSNDAAGLLITRCELEKTAKQADGEAAIDSG
jgi:hypothetical protein